MKLTLEAGTCPGGPCPSIYGDLDDPERVVLQDAEAPAAENVGPPVAGERRIVMRRQFLLDWAAAQLSDHER
ncbi:MAG: hypothetical protein ACREDE_10880 [Thermoplasmata archaeon]